MQAKDLAYEMSLMDAGSYLLVVPEFPGDSRVEMSVVKSTEGCWYFTDERQDGGPVMPESWAHFILVNDVEICEH